MELGIASPLTHTGACTFVKGWLLDTATIYKIGITRTGTTLTALGLGSVVVGSVMMALSEDSAWNGLGLWTGFILTVCGITCLIKRQKRPHRRLSVLSIVCLTGFVASLVSLVTSSFNLWAISHDYNSRYPDYVMSLPEYKMSLSAMNGLLLTMSIFQAVFTVWSFCLSIDYVWPCLRISNSSIFTIMVDEDPLDRTLHSEHDTEMSAFHMHNGNVDNDQQRTLHIQTEWLHQVPKETQLGR